MHLIAAWMMACTPQEPEDVRGTTPGEPAETTPITSDSGQGVVCSDGPAFPDAWAGALDPERITNTPPSHDAGIAAIIDALPSSGSATISIEVTEAVVANFTEYGGGLDQLWLSDSSGGLQTFGPDIPFTADELQPGDTVSFTATEITSYYDLPELTGLTGLSIASQGGMVYVVEGNTTTISLAEHLNQNIRGYGAITSEPEGCGGSSVCADFTFGDNTAILRFSDSLGLAVGDCVDVLAPLTIFSGAPQLNLDNNDWVSVY